MPAPTPVNYSATVDAVTTQQFMRGEWNDTKKKRALLERLDKKGNIDENGSGTYCEWRSRVGEYQTADRADLASRSFARKNHRIVATLPWNFTEITGVLSDRDIQLNRGKEAIVELKNSMITEMGEDFRKSYNSKLLKDNASTNTVMGQAAYAGSDVPFYGLPTVFNPGATLYRSGTVSTALAATDKYVKAAGTYAGHSTVLNGLSGVDNALPNAWSPLLVNIGYDWNGSTTKTWAVNALHVLNELMTGLAHGDSEEDFPDLVVMDPTYYNQFKSLLQSKQQILVGDTPSSPDAGLAPRLHIPYQGATVVFDNDQISGAVYALNTSKLKVKVVPAGEAGSADGALGGSAGEMFGITQQHSIEQGGHLVVVSLASQLCVDVRYQGCAFLWA